MNDCQQCHRCGRTDLPTARVEPPHRCPHGAACEAPISCPDCAAMMARRNDLRRQANASLPGARAALLSPVPGIAMGLVGVRRNS